MFNLLKGGIKEMEMQEIKEILNNLNLLRFVRKHSADNLLDDNKLAKEKFNIKTNENSISVLDSTNTKLFVSNSDFEGEIFTRFNIKQLSELLDTIGKTEGELLIPLKSDLREMIAKVGNDVIVVSPLPKADKKKK